MIALEPHAEGWVLPVKAQPGASSNGIRGEWNGMLKVCVTQAPEKGKANQAIIAVLANAFALRKSQIELLNGDTDSRKKFLLRECVEAELRRLLKDLVGNDGCGSSHDS